MRTKKLRMLAATAAAALGMLLFASPALAGDWTVNSVADDSDADLCADTDCTLREAIRESASTTLDDTISFNSDAQGEIVLTSALPELPDVEIRGPGARDLTVTRSSAAGTPRFGIFAVGAGRTVKISGLTILGGNSDFGGGIRNQGTLTLEQSEVSGNSATEGGGGVFGGGGTTPTTTNIVSSTFSYNDAGRGGGVDFASNAGGTITNSTFFRNLADREGGAIYSGGSPTITGATISGNDAGVEGGGIFGLSPTVLRGSVVAGNGAPASPDAPGPVTDGGFNRIGGTASAAGLQTDSSGDPVLRNNGGSTPTIALLENSPLIDAGNAFGSTTDQRGYARPQDEPDVPDAAGGDGSDVGAVEALTLSISDTTVTEGDTGGTDAVFTVRLSRPASSPVRLLYGTWDGTATSPDDYAATPGTLSFSPGETSKTIAVPVNDDALSEPDETFSVDLSSPQGAGATLSDASATGTIEDDDPPDVLRTTPTGGRVSPTANVTATFTRAMDESTLTGSTVKLVRKGKTAPVGATITVSPDGKTVTLNPNRSLVRRAAYTATITTGAKDLDGNPLAQDRSWSFRVRR